MDITMIIFSPSGNTVKAASKLKERLESESNNVQFLDVSRDKRFFSSTDKMNYLNEAVNRHDVLVIGAPVYAHHLQYHMKDLLKLLPKPDSKWGRYAVPFVTYGGVSSGIALEEAGKILTGRGRVVSAGMKASMPHRATRNFMSSEYNSDYDEGDLDAKLDELVSVINSLDEKSKNNSKAFRYRSRKEFIIDNIVFNEKKWHEKRYPQIHIDEDRCLKCFLCVEKCPVGHLQNINGKLVLSETNLCIHCGNCSALCSSKAVSVIGDLAKIREFFMKITRNGKETPGTLIYN